MIALDIPALGQFACAGIFTAALFFAIFCFTMHPVYFK
jgi:hypothetical protein